MSQLKTLLAQSWLVCLVVAISSTANAAWPRAFDIAQFVCTSSELEITELGVQFFEVHYDSMAAGQTGVVLSEYKYLLVDVSNKNDHQGGSGSASKWCLYQVDLRPATSKVLQSWACEWDRILRMARELMAAGNINSVHNITTKMVDSLKALDKYNLQMLRVMVGCEDYQANASQELAQLSEQLQSHDQQHHNSTDSSPVVVTDLVNGTSFSALMNGTGEMLNATESFISTSNTSNTTNGNVSIVTAKEVSSLNRIKRDVTSSTLKSSTFAPLRSIAVPVVIMIAIALVVVIFLVVYVYVFNGGIKKLSDRDGSGAGHVYGNAPKPKSTMATGGGGVSGSEANAKTVKPDSSKVPNSLVASVKSKAVEPTTIRSQA